MEKSLVTRHHGNPLIVPGDVKPSRGDFEVMCVFNPGATVFQGRDLLLVRVAERPIPQEGCVATAVINPDSGNIEPLYFALDDPKLKYTDPRVLTYDGVVYLTSISHFRVARPGTDGRFIIDDKVTMQPVSPFESYGIEDPRITLIDDQYLITYTAVSPLGINVALARTCDFRTFERMGIIFVPDNKDVAIFPEKIDNRFFAFHRPSISHVCAPSLWLASSSDLLDWGHHHLLISPRPGKWDCERVGCGAAPVKTQHGWLELYHASDNKTRYCTGAMLLDLREPWNIIARSDEPFFVPEAPYESQGLMPNVVFHNGLVDNNDGSLTLYYGAADECLCSAKVDIESILSTLLS